jgi:hypothetical protein
MNTFGNTAISIAGAYNRSGAGRGTGGLMSLPCTLGELRKSHFSEQRMLRRSVKDELRENLLTRLRAGGPVFPGIVGYDDTVIPQLVNAILSRHNFILLGLRGQAKSRILRALTSPAARSATIPTPRSAGGARTCWPAKATARPSHG